MPDCQEKNQRFDEEICNKKQAGECQKVGKSVRFEQNDDL